MKKWEVIGFVDGAGREGESSRTYGMATRKKSGECYHTALKGTALKGTYFRMGISPQSEAGRTLGACDETSGLTLDMFFEYNF